MSLRPTRRTVLAGLAAGAVTGLPARAAHDFNAAIPWAAPEPGLAAARADSRPIFLLVDASWCDVCETYSKLFHDPRVVAALEPYQPVRADRDADTAFEKGYRPDGGYVPRSLILTPAGEIRADVIGPFEAWRHYLPTKSPEPLLDYLAQGLA